MNKTKTYLLALIVLVGATVLVLALYQSQKMTANEQIDNFTADLESQSQGQAESSVISTSSSDAAQNSDKSKHTRGIYAEYSKEHLSEGDNILFFKASWCPTCSALDKDIKANLNEIPRNTKILQVNYDKADELKQKYRVTYQHTLVQVDANGKQIKKWSGSMTLEKLLEEVV